MIKFLLTLIAVVVLFRILMRVLLGGFMVKVEKHYYHGPPRSKPEPEGTVRIEKPQTGMRKRYRDDEGDYTDYEEVKD
jgi:hypothetical protein